MWEFIFVSTLIILGVLVAYMCDVEQWCGVVGLLFAIFICVISILGMTGAFDPDITYLSKTGERAALIAVYEAAPPEQKDKYLSDIYGFNAEVSGTLAKDDSPDWWRDIPLISADELKRCVSD